MEKGKDVVFPVFKWRSINFIIYDVFNFIVISFSNKVFLIIYFILFKDVVLIFIFFVKILAKKIRLIEYFSQIRESFQYKVNVEIGYMSK